MTNAVTKFIVALFVMVSMVACGGNVGTPEMDGGSMGDAAQADARLLVNPQNPLVLRAEVSSDRQGIAYSSNWSSLPKGYFEVTGWCRIKQDSFAGQGYIRFADNGCEVPTGNVSITYYPAEFDLFGVRLATPGEPYAYKAVGIVAELCYADGTGCKLCEDWGSDPATSCMAVDEFQNYYLQSSPDMLWKSNTVQLAF